MHPPDTLASVDFETYYDKEYSLSEMGTWEYVFHEKFDAYMVAIYSADIQFVGHPKDFDWKSIAGRTFIHHNASFDGLVIQRLMKDGVIPADAKPSRTVDTADLAAYLKVMRNLKTASKYLLNIEVSKAARDAAKGKKSSELMADPTMLEYALGDARNAYNIWVQYSNLWSEDEQLISSWNREAGWKGVYVDQEYLDWAIEQVSAIRFEAEKLIPWKNWRETHKTPLSAAKIRMGCRDAGIPCPSSFAKDSDECEEWEDKYGPKFPWIAALRDWRRSNTFLTKLLTIRQRVRDDGTMPYGIKYFGAHTGRMSSDGGVNLLNLEKFPKFAEQVAPFKDEKKQGVDIRRVFVARPGKVLYLADLSQIEARVTNLLCGNYAFLEACKTMSPYEAHARTSMGWKGGDLKKENPKLYALAKARILALGFGAGYKKFIIMMRLYGIKPEEIFTETPTEGQVCEFIDWLTRCEKKEDLQEFADADAQTKRIMVGAWLQVQDFRLNNPLLRGFWNMLEQGIRTSASHRENFDIRVPSGRVMSYVKPFERDGNIMAWVVRGDKPKHFYSGKMCENLSQMLARDYFVAGQCRLLRAGFTILWTVYDEYVIEADLEKDYTAEIADIVRDTPDWGKACPIDVEIQKSHCYTK